MARRTTFREILDAVADANVARLAARAKSFNRIAKLEQAARSRAAAYAGKTRAAEQLLAKFPERCRFLSLEGGQRAERRADGSACRVLVGLNLGGRVCLHYPSAGFSSNAREQVDRLRMKALATVVTEPSAAKLQATCGRRVFAAGRSGFFDNRLMEAA
jgi:hypothetical protein